MREALPRADEQYRPDDGDRDALGTDAGSQERQRYCHVEQRCGEPLAPRTRPHSELPGYEPNYEAKHQPVDRGLDVHDGNLLAQARARITIVLVHSGPSI